MSKEKPGEQPYTPEEIRELIKSKKLKVVMATTAEVDKHLDNVHRLLTYIGGLMDYDEEDKKDFVDNCFVSDQSMVLDFLREATQFEKLSKMLGFKVTKKDYIADIAKLMDTN